MGVKAIYRNVIRRAENIPVTIGQKKTLIAEWYEIYKKHALYKNVKWSEEQKKEFDAFWIANYGRRISPRWHKLYESINGEYNYRYIPDYLYTCKLESRGNRYAYAKVFQDKANVELLIANTEVVVPRTLVLCTGGVLRDADYRAISNDVAEMLISDEKRIVIKPTVGGSSGQSVKIVERDDLNRSTFQEIKKEYNDEFIIQEAISANSQFKALHPNSINTLRVITYVIDGKVYSAPVSMRIGTGSSSVDNIHAGGCTVAVSDEGKLSKYAYSLGYCDSKLKFERHPDTKIEFENYEIPLVKEIIENAKVMHLKMPHIQFASWDFTVNSDNNVVLIEVNLLGQSVWFPQIVSGKELFGENTEKMIRTLKR